MSPPPRPLRVGLTGGIASGKTLVSRMFAARGVPVIDTDELAREVVAPGSDGLAAVRARFGDGVLAADGSLDRRALRARVFADPDARRDLEAITHPRIRALVEARSAAAGGRYQVIVIPLLVESGRRTPVDRVLVVDCPESLQLERLLRRDGGSREQAEAILAAQASRAQRLAVADDVIVNAADPQAVESEVDALHRRYLALSPVADSDGRGGLRP
ncbi:MAG: dephospho-CoA kinase [Steroidobacteraceae bacterium]